jgi:hypothetical protein
MQLKGCEQGCSGERLAATLTNAPFSSRTLISSRLLSSSSYCPLSIFSWRLCQPMWVVSAACRKKLRGQSSYVQQKLPDGVRLSAGRGFERRAGSVCCMNDARSLLSRLCLRLCGAVGLILAESGGGWPDAACRATTAALVSRASAARDRACAARDCFCSAS